VFLFLVYSSFPQQRKKRNILIREFGHSNAQVASKKFSTSNVSSVSHRIMGDIDSISRDSLSLETLANFMNCLKGKLLAHHPE
jgi:hypothetical protein